MKTVVTMVLLTTLFLSCSSIKGTKKLNTYYGDVFFYPGSLKIKPGPRNGWVEDYKQNSFYQCLSQGYKNDSIFKLIHKEDIFLESPLPMSLWPKVRMDSKKIIDSLPETEYYNDETDKHKRHILETCLCYFASRELDSIAKEEYKLFKKDKINKDYFE
jgi:hypothetical protein